MEEPFLLYTVTVVYLKISFYYLVQGLQVQDKSSDIEQQPPFGDGKYSNTLPRKRGGGYKTNGNII